MESGGSLPASFSQMREAEELVDVCLVFDGTRVPCHKVVLAATCDYFKRMFLINMSEQTSGEVIVKGISSTTGLLVVDYLYSMNTEITVDNAQGLLEASDMLMLDKLKQNVEQFLTGQIEAQNCVSILNLGRLFELKALFEASQKFLTDHLDEAMDTMEMEKLQEEDLVHVLKKHASQEACFCVLQKWVRCTARNADHFMELLQHVELCRCSKQFIHTTVLDEEMMAYTQGLQIIKKAVQADQYSTQNKSLAVGDFEGGIWVRADREDWKRIDRTCIPLKSSYYSACVSPEGVIFSGGCSGDEPKRDCFSFCVQEREWRTLPPMTKARYYHSSVYHNAHLYIVGGRTTDESYLDSVETLNLETLQWSRLPPLPLALSDCFAVSVSNSLFVLGGGKTPTQFSKELCQYDSSQKSWRSCAPMPEDCRTGSATSFQDKVFVVGGRNMSCMLYDPRVDSWTTLQRPQLEHAWGVSLEWNDKIILLGGEKDDSIEEYCPQTDQWSKWDLKLPKPGMMCFALKM